MLTFTTDFRTAALADIRDPRAMVEVSWGTSLTDKNVVITSNDFNRIDRSGQVRKIETTSGQKWAFLGNEIVADGTFYACPALDSEPQMGWFNSTLSDGSGDFSTAPWLQIAHDARPYSEITVVGDSEYNEYPVDFTITITHPGGPTTIPVTGNASRIWTDSFTTITGVTAVKIEVTKWSAANTLLKIIQFSGSLVETYRSDDIVSLDILEETNTDTGTVPLGSVTSNELDLSLLNTDRRFSLGNTDSIYNEVLVSNRKIRVWLGFVLSSGSGDVTGDVTGYIVETEGTDKIGYMPYGVYWSKDWISSHDSMETTTTAYDIVYKLSQTDFLHSGIYQNETIEDTLDEILTDALTYIPDLEWSISSDTGSDVLNIGYSPVQSYLETIKNVMEAAQAYAYVDRTGVLILGSRLGVTTPVSAWQELGLSEYFDYRSEPKIDELVNSVRVSYVKYAIQAVEDIYTDTTVFEIPAGETELEIYLSWEKTPVSPSYVVISYTIVSGSITFEESIYSVGARIKATGTAGNQFTLSATGRPYTLTEYTEVTASDEDSIAKYGKREFALTNNQFISTAEEAQEIAENLITFYGDLRQDGELTWPGSTLVAVGDTVEVTEFKSDTVETKDYFLIMRQSINFDGALNAEIELRRG